MGFYACNNLPVVHPCQKMTEGPGKTSSTLVVTKTIAEKLGDLIYIFRTSSLNQEILSQKSPGVKNSVPNYIIQVCPAGYFKASVAKH